MQFVTKFWKTKIITVMSSIAITAVVWGAFAWGRLRRP